MTDLGAYRLIRAAVIAASAVSLAVVLVGCSAIPTPSVDHDAGTSVTQDAPSTPAGPTLTVSQQQAVIAAKGYLEIGGFSYQGLIGQLSSSAGNGFSVADATAAVDSLNVDYNAQAVDAAKSYLKIGGFSHASLVEQLSSASGSQFTPAQAEYATTQVGL